MTADPRIEEIRQRAEAATKGPWEIDGIVIFNGVKAEAGVYWTPPDREPTPSDEICRTAFDDAVFIAHARSDIPFLLDHIEKLEERCEGYKGQVKAGGEEIERLRAEREKLVKALTFVRDIEKPVSFGQPSPDWLAWYTTSSQQSDAAALTLSALQSGPNP